MKPPICCHKPAKEIFKRFCTDGVIHSVLYGFQCMVCGHFGVPFFKDWDNSYMESLENIRLQGIEFDKTELGQRLQKVIAERERFRLGFT